MTTTMRATGVNGGAATTSPRGADEAPAEPKGTPVHGAVSPSPLPAPVATLLQVVAEDAERQRVEIESLMQPGYGR